MLDAIHPGTYRHLQLGEGALLRAFDLDTALASGDPAAALAEALQSSANLIGATKEGCTFRCTPAIKDTTRGHRTPSEGETLTGRWEVTLSGTLMEITPDNAAMLLNVPLYVNSGSYTAISPKPVPAPTAISDVCWVGDMGAGLLIIQLQRPVSIGGMVFRATRNGLGEAAFTLKAHKHNPEDAELPCRLVWLKGVEL